MLEQVTRNVKLAAYLRMRGVYPAVRPITQGKTLVRGKVLYTYKMTEPEWQAHKAEFDKSEFLTYAQNLDAVLDLAY